MSPSTRRGHVRQRGDTFTAYWRVRSEDGKSKQASKGGFATAKAAEQHLTNILRQIDTGAYVEPDRKARSHSPSSCERTAACGQGIAAAVDVRLLRQQPRAARDPDARLSTSQRGASRRVSLAAS
jgi:hypothetical protein